MNPWLQDHAADASGQIDALAARRKTVPPEPGAAARRRIAHALAVAED